VKKRVSCKSVAVNMDRTCVTPDVTATHATLQQLKENTEQCGCKLYMDNSFLSLESFNNLTKKKFNCCGAVRPNRKECHRTQLAACICCSPQMLVDFYQTTRHYIPEESTHNNLFCMFLQGNPE
jgi:hypothetical protein